MVSFEFNEREDVRGSKVQHRSLFGHSFSYFSINHFRSAISLLLQLLLQLLQSFAVIGCCTLPACKKELMKVLVIFVKIGELRIPVNEYPKGIHSRFQ
jgi:hypothetical protein